MKKNVSICDILFLLCGLRLVTVNERVDHVDGVWLYIVVALVCFPRELIQLVLTKFVAFFFFGVLPGGFIFERDVSMNRSSCISCSREGG